MQGRGCKANEAVVRESQLQGAVFEDADFRGADLSDSNLIDATFTGTDLRGANISRCRLGWTDFSNCRMSETEVTGAVGTILGPINIGSTEPRLLNGTELAEWFAVHGAPDVDLHAN
ncbi:pentapeptide repeat-containing protein [Nocardia sp. NPDC049149]|uniref:pentapeptide repeat-containing protein n=1 Tax=Nocardia sp. NPDC049149 TaxID=3364315 RepID=UPI0037227BE3